MQLKGVSVFRAKKNSQSLGVPQKLGNEGAGASQGNGQKSFLEPTSTNKGSQWSPSRCGMSLIHGEGFLGNDSHEVQRRNPIDLIKL